MNGIEIWQEAGRAFSQATDAERGFLEASAEPDVRMKLLLQIKAALASWWHDDPEQIPRLLYRIDVDEVKAKTALMSPDPISALAEEILDRLRLTAMSRITYRESRK
ncbi:MAG: hypothetical protein NWR72_00095 [Bacteroidia bacterium]|nr:hypothetical protein [Bacteroidia bacterium]